MKKYAKHINVPEWLWKAIEEALHERLRELNTTFQMGMSARLGLYKPSPWHKYFSRVMLSHAIDTLDLGTICNPPIYTDEVRKIKFFKNEVD